MPLFGTGWDDDEEDEEARRALEADPERRALRDQAIAQATRDVRLVKRVHLALVLVFALLFAVAAWVKLG
jgi:hypothetical protein